MIPLCKCNYATKGLSIDNQNQELFIFKLLQINLENKKSFRLFCNKLLGPLHEAQTSVGFEVTFYFLFF